MIRIIGETLKKKDRIQADNGSEDPIRCYLSDRIFTHRNRYRTEGGLGKNQTACIAPEAPISGHKMRKYMLSGSASSGIKDKIFSRNLKTEVKTHVYTATLVGSFLQHISRRIYCLSCHGHIRHPSNIYPGNGNRKSAFCRSECRSERGSGNIRDFL